MGAEVIRIERPKTGDSCRWNPAGPQGVSHARKTDEDPSLLYLKRNRGKKVPCDAVPEIPEVLEDPQLKAGGMMPSPAPSIGQHNREV
jgi:crotonobetainyl-CoA:carnitine CoA-transferase CaiB-like acyl-CoA transferase